MGQMILHSRRRASLDLGSRRAPGFLCALFLLSCATLSSAQSSRDALETFTAPDDTFSFRYPSQLIVCTNTRDSGWVPAENCAAYHPVCDGETPETYTSIACLAYPRNQFTDTGAFEAATFSVEVLNGISNKKNCLAKPTEEIFQRRAAIKIHGILFAVFEFGEGGMSQSVGGDVYRTFHGGKCFQIGINTAMADPGAFDPPARELSKRDSAEVSGALQQARDSFAFLK